MPTDEIFDDEYMNHIMMNPDMYNLENREQKEYDDEDDDEQMDKLK